jgi:uncharacterized protein (TIRG00374 family)
MNTIGPFTLAGVFKKKTAFISFAVSMAILAVLVYWLGLPAILKTLEQTNLWGILAGFLLLLLAQPVRVLKWRFFLSQHLAFWDTSTLYFSSKLLGAVTPARTGEAAPLLLARFRKPSVAAFLFADHLAEIAATILLAIPGLFLLDVPKLLSWSLLAGALLCIIIIMALANSSRLANKLKTMTHPNARLQSILVFIATSINALQTIRNKFWLLISLSLVPTGIELLAYVAVFQSVGAAVNVVRMALATCLWSIVATISFIPGGHGIADAVLISIIPVIGCTKAELGAFIICMKSIGVFLLPLAMFVAWQVSLYFLKGRQAPAPAK